ncbi:retroviral-like aspartic protease family protein [Maribacter litopenaei]|uniref:Retroviral-like aspartic protease family protein n=1 Tax=Maribacter litopenaei TaxID=2976127 RepID=A0ABY5YB67_9FLAO|nr:retropepsin-like aspartic protease [Maribacter litopenaei]UWX55454.1 retroviral-like aspartic protease family protein [Maribacter litopenaei]
MSSLKKYLKKKGYHKIPLTMTKTHHPELSAKINGNAGRFILDTGASNTCIGSDRIAYFKLKSKESKIKAAGAGATDMETSTSKKNSIEIGKWHHKKLKIVLFDLVHVNTALITHDAEPVDGIIGADVLDKGKAIIDYKKKALYLKVKK